MPCRSDYMEQSSYELEIMKTAKLLVWLKKQLNFQITTIENKCAKDGSYPSKQDGDVVVSTLCSILSNFDTTQLNQYVYNARVRESRELATWWEEHQEADRIRIAEEQREQKLILLVAQLKQTLSADEQEAINQYWDAV